MSKLVTRLTHQLSAKISLHQEDVLVIETKRPPNLQITDITLVSVIGIIAYNTSSFSLIRKVIDNHTGVSMWRANRIVQKLNKRDKIPVETLYSHNLMIIRERISSNGSIPEFLLKRTYDCLLEKRTAVLSSLMNGFHLKILSKSLLKKAFIYKETIKEFWQEIPYDMEYIRSVTDLERVPKRIIPLLPCSNGDVKIPVGKLFLNSQQEVGFKKLPKLMMIGGSDRNLLIGTLQSFTRTVARSGKKIMIIDVGNELGGLREAIREEFDQEVPLKEFHIGRNFLLNLYNVDIPASQENPISRMVFKANSIANILGYASDSTTVRSNLPLLKTKFFDAIQKHPSHEYSIAQFIESEVFAKPTSEFEFSIIEQLSAELSIFAEFEHLNALRFSQEFDEHLEPSPGITLFHFPTQISLIKRVTFAFLLQKIGIRCDSKTIVIITDASQMLTNYDENLHKEGKMLYKETIGKYLNRITRTGCLTLVTSSLARLPPDIQGMKSSVIALKLVDPLDREWLIQRFALKRYLDNPNDFLESLDGEGVLFRHDSPHTVDHYIPYTLAPVFEQEY